MNLHKEMVYAEIKDYAFITLGLLLYTFAWTVFLLPYQIVNRWSYRYLGIDILCY